MPEGHTVHRLAATFGELFDGSRVSLSSPQGRFAGGAALLDGRVLVASEAYGKQMFLGFAAEDRTPRAGAPAPDPAPGSSPDQVPDVPQVPDADPAADLLWLRIHLGLYGAWTFAGDPTTDVVHAIGAPRKRVGERETLLDRHPAGSGGGSAGYAVTGGDASGSGREPADGDWLPPAPRGAVRVRLESGRACADLTGPTACEVLSTAEARAVQRRLGPDPLRPDSDPQRFVDAVARSRSPIGVLLMNQDVIAGVGNIYRAEALFRAGQNPLAPGTTVPSEVVLEIWQDVAELMADGVRIGAIVTTRPEDRASGDRVPDIRAAGQPDVGRGRRLARQNTDADPGAVAREDSFYVYQRDGLPCRICRTPIALSVMATRNLFRCPTCQP